MKLRYLLALVVTALFGVYFFLNGFSFDNLTFSSYLITTLCILLSTCIVGVSTYALLTMKKKRSSYKEVMTIRQYYQLKS